MNLAEMGVESAAQALTDGGEKRHCISSFSYRLFVCVLGGVFSPVSA